jgi:hypothetical protein
VLLGTRRGGQWPDLGPWWEIRMTSLKISSFIKVSVESFSFPIVMDELTRGIQEEEPWNMLFADDVILMYKS